MSSIVYLNGNFLPEEHSVVPVTARGFFGGDGVYEVTRTFNHRLFRLDDHIERLFRSLAYVRIDPGLSREQMTAATSETLERNLQRLDDNGDFALWHVVTRGDRVSGEMSPAIVAMFCVDMDFDRYADAYLDGLALVTPGTRRTPPQRIDPRGKVTSRMNQMQAALEVSATSPGAVPLLLDIDGNVAETNTGNFFVISDGQLLTPRGRNVLGGVTRKVVLELAAGLDLETIETDLTLYDVYAADEAFVSGTSPSIVPVSTLNGASTNRENILPGPVTYRLMRAFCDLTGKDYVAQAIASLGGNRTAVLARRWAERCEQDGTS